MRSFASMHNDYLDPDRYLGEDGEPETDIDELISDRKDIKDKPNPLLMPYVVLEAYSKVSDYGCKKYGNRDSWKHSATGVETYTAATARHLYKFADNHLDEESSLCHLYHALWSISAAIWHYERIMNQ